MLVLKEKNGKILDINTLELLGYWFEVDNIVYFCKI